jgi:hypothetical protein
MEERKKIENKMGKDYEIALLIIEELIPYSLEYYLGLRMKKDETENIVIEKEEK